MVVLLVVLKQKLLAFGLYPGVTLADAREQHQEACKLVAMRIDPSAKKQAEKAAPRAAKEHILRFPVCGGCRGSAASGAVVTSRQPRQTRQSLSAC